MNDLESRLRAALHDETAELAARPDLADDMVTRGTKVRRRRRVVGGAAGLVVLAALVPVWKTIDTSSGQLPPAHHPTPTGITQSHPPDTTPTTHAPPYWSTDPKDVTHAAGKQPRVVNVRVGEHPRFDRVVIDFVGPAPEYHVGYVPSLVQEGSGNPIDLPGARFLHIRLPTSVAHDRQGNSVYTGPTLIRYTMATLRGVAFLGDFEGVSFGLALSRHAGFHVSELSTPTRLVIDLQH